MRPFFYLLKIGLILSCASVSNAQMASSFTGKKCAHTFKVGLVFNEPLYFVSPQRQLRGSSLEVIHELRKRTGCEFVVEEFSRPSLIEKFRRAQVDLAIVSVKTVEMDNVAQFLHLFSSPRGLVLSPRLASKIKSVRQAMDHKKIVFGNIIGTQTYYKLEEYESLRKAKRLIDLPDYPSLFKAVEKNRIQAFVGSLMIASYYVNKMSLKDYSIIVDDDFHVPIGCYVDPRRLSEEQIQIIKQTLFEMLKDGSFVKIYSHYSPLEMAQKSIIPVQVE